MKTGRPIKAGVLRDERGRSRGVPLDALQRDAVSVVAAQRAARGIAPGSLLDPLAGYPIGRMRLVGQMGDAACGISEKQFLAAQSYSKIIHRNATLMGFASPHPIALDMNGSGGAGCGPDPDDKVIWGARGKARDCRRVLLDAGAQIGVGARVNATVYAVVIEQRDEMTLSEDERGWLRVGLNALDRMTG